MRGCATLRVVSEITSEGWGLCMRGCATLRVVSEVTLKLSQSIRGVEGLRELRDF